MADKLKQDSLRMLLGHLKIGPRKTKSIII